ncbi:MAG: hypothetical protein WAO76_16085 [Georgfuchsia sp.]
MNTFDWTVPTDHPAFDGHFPSQPIVPGVVLLDRLLLCLTEMHHGISGTGLKIGNAKFSSPARPGEALRFTLQEKSAGILQFRIECLDNGGRDIASGTLTRPAPILP